MGKIVGATFPKPEQEKPVEIKVIVDGEPVALVDRGAVMDLVEAVQAIVLNKVQSNEA